MTYSFNLKTECVRLLTYCGLAEKPYNAPLPLKKQVWYYGAGKVRSPIHKKKLYYQLQKTAPAENAVLYPWNYSKSKVITGSRVRISTLRVSTYTHKGCVLFQSPRRAASEVGNTSYDREKSTLYTLSVKSSLNSLPLRKHYISFTHS
jgi:hypothetical protein